MADHLFGAAQSGAPSLFWITVTLALAVTLGAVAVVDLRRFRIPDALSLPLGAAGLGLSFWWPAFGPDGTRFADHLIGAAGAFLLFAVIGWAIHRRTGREALGLGDAKLFGAAGAWLGWQLLPSVLLIASLGGLVFALIERQFARRARASPASLATDPGAIAFGPWLAVAFLAVWVLQTG